MARTSHPKKDIEEAIMYAEREGWRVEVGGSYAWGRIYCPYNDAECRCGEFCITSVWSTPKSPGNPRVPCDASWITAQRTVSSMRLTTMPRSS